MLLFNEHGFNPEWQVFKSYYYADVVRKRILDDPIHEHAGNLVIGKTSVVTDDGLEEYYALYDVFRSYVDPDDEDWFPVELS